MPAIASLAAGGGRGQSLVECGLCLGDVFSRVAVGEGGTAPTVGIGKRPQYRQVFRARDARFSVDFELVIVAVDQGSVVEGDRPTARKSPVTPDRPVAGDHVAMIFDDDPRRAQPWIPHEPRTPCSACADPHAYRNPPSLLSVAARSRHAVHLPRRLLSSRAPTQLRDLSAVLSGGRRQNGAMSDGVSVARGELRQVATAARAQLLAAAADPGVPAVVRRSRSASMRLTNARMEQLLQQPRDRDDRRVWDLARQWFTCAVGAYWYRLSAYESAERRAWDVLSTLPVGSVAGAELRSLREAVDDAEVVAAFQLRDVTAAVEQAADTFNRVKRHGAPGGDPLQAAATAFAWSSAAPAEDPQTWPVIDQVELQWRMRTDGINIRLGLALGAGKTAPAADRQYLPWLNDTITAVDRPMSVAALTIRACVR